jgi:hypothetical protein
MMREEYARSYHSPSSWLKKLPGKIGSPRQIAAWYLGFHSYDLHFGENRWLKLRTIWVLIVLLDIVFSQIINKYKRKVNWN